MKRDGDPHGHGGGHPDRRVRGARLEDEMQHVIDSTAACVPLSPRLIAPGHVRYTVVHRLSLATRADANPNPIPDEQLIGAEAAERFLHPGLGTGGQMPYHVLIQHSGWIEQCLPLLVRGAHASNYNWQSWAIAVAGNSDEREMRDCQWASLLHTVAVLSVVGRSVAGHTELPNASKDPTKRCPGRFVNMDHVREEALRRLPPGCEEWKLRQRIAHVVRAGFTL